MEVGEEVGEAEIVRRKAEEGGEGKTETEGAEPALVLRFGTVAGRSWVGERGKTEAGGSGERGSGDAVGGRRFWRTGVGEGGESVSW